jgi:hypothetical protein
LEEDSNTRYFHRGDNGSFILSIRKRVWLKAMSSSSPILHLVIKDCLASRRNLIYLWTNLGLIIYPKCLRKKTLFWPSFIIRRR